MKKIKANIPAEKGIVKKIDSFSVVVQLDHQKGRRVPGKIDIKIREGMSEPDKKLVEEFTIAVLQFQCAMKALEEVGRNIRASLLRAHKVAGMEDQFPVALKDK